jgi:hypothetical protein
LDAADLVKGGLSAIVGMEAKSDLDVRVSVVDDTIIVTMQGTSLLRGGRNPAIGMRIHLMTPSVASSVMTATAAAITAA